MRATQTNTRAALPSAPPAALSDSFSPDSLKTVALPDLIDQFGPLDAQVAGFKPTVKKHEAYRKEIERRYESHPADSSAVAEGQRYSVAVGPRGVEREPIDAYKLFDYVKKAIGIERIKEECRFRLSFLDSVIPVSQQSLFISQKRTGRRTVEVSAKAQPLKA